MVDPPAYRVGRGRPPRHTQFKKGQSGNPVGRPKGARGLRQVVADELLREVTAKENGQPVRVPALGAVARKIISEAVRGDVKIALALVQLGIALDVADRAGEAEVEDATPPEDELILAEYRQRVLEQDGHD